MIRENLTYGEQEIISNSRNKKIKGQLIIKQSSLKKNWIKTREK